MAFDFLHGRVRRVGLVIFALGFALMSVPLGLSLAQTPAMVEVDREMQQLRETEAEFKGGGWMAGNFERDLDRAGGHAANLGNFATLVGVLLLVGGGWLGRDTREGRRALVTVGALVAALVAMTAVGFIARSGPFQAASDIMHVAVVGTALAYVAASRGSRTALVVGIIAAASRIAGTLAWTVLDRAWLAEVSPLAARAMVPFLLWLSCALTAAAFAAGAATRSRGDGRAWLPGNHHAAAPTRFTE